MKTRKLIFIIVGCILTLSPGNGLAGDPGALKPSAVVSADKNTVNIGDIIAYRLVLSVPEAVECELPFLNADKIGEFSLRGFKKNEQVQNKEKIITIDCALTIFQTGEQSIPGPKILYRADSRSPWQELSPEPVKINVASLLPKERSGEIKPLKPKLRIWHSLFFMLSGILAGLLVMAGAILFWLGRRKKKAAEKPALPAHLIAYGDLEALRGLNLIALGRVEEYFQKLSGCVRHYLENRFHVRAPLMSTEEFLESAKAAPFLNAGHKKLLKGFLELSDMVKFARYSSSAKEAEEAFFAARNFVDQTKEEIPEAQSPKT